MAERGKRFRDRLRSLRPSIRDVFVRYRLIRYIKPYKLQLGLMLGSIVLYSACHGGQLLLVRQLLMKDLWVPPVEPPAMSVDGIIARLPDALESKARAAACNALAPSFEQALSKKQVRKITLETITATAGRLANALPGDVRFAPVVENLVRKLDDQDESLVLRRIYEKLSHAALAAVQSKLPEKERAELAAAIDKGFADPPGARPNVARVRQLCLGLVGLALLVGVMVVLRTVARAWILAQVTRDVRNDLCRHITGLDMQFFASRSSGEMISRQTHDTGTGTRALGYLFDTLAVQPFMALTYIAAAFYVSWQLALLFCVVLPLLVFPLVRLVQRVKKYGRKGLEQIAELTTLMSEMFHGVRVLKAFQAEDRKMGEYQGANERLARRMRKSMKLKGMTRGLTETFANMLLAGAMFLGASLVITGLWGFRMSAPDVLMFGGCIIMISRPIKAFVRDWSNFMEAIAASERVFEVFDIRSKIQEAPDAVELPPLQRSLAFRDVSFAYATGPLVLEDVDFEVERGQVVAVVGHSGAGKSTLLDLIPRYYDPASGRVEIDGVDIRRATLASLRSQIAIVSQDPFLFRTSVRENIRYGRFDATDADIVEAAKAANIHDFIHGLADGYDTLCGERGTKLSGGQRQRITIARALLKDAPILILDEATSSLDADSQRLVHDALHRLMEHRTTFVIAHRLSTVQHAQRIVVLREGRLVETGTHTELLDARGEYWRLYKTEFAKAESVVAPQEKPE